MGEHTELPWSVGTNGRSVVKDAPGMADGCDAYMIAVASSHSLLLPSETKANAAFIVKAVNNHEALVEAVRDFITILDEAQSGFISGSGSDLAWQKGREERVAAGRLLLSRVGGSPK